MPCDLHVHTTFSDGTDTPGRVVEEACGAGLSALAITDHDSIDGVLPALEVGKRLSFPVLPGVELSTEEEGREVHILGYLFRIDHCELLGRLSLFRRARVERVVKMVEKLRSLGIPVEVEQVLGLAGGGSVGR
ncbi:PHP domain-containing protein, partial [Desulfofundulus sp.]|uniref:PHP domain-containing protein n=1 Tax=Desulfofundulus sp. TaxID=2282750 RepID=UPI003C70D942